MDLVGCRPRGAFREYQTCSRGRLSRFLLGIAAVLVGAVALLALLLAGFEVRILLHDEGHGFDAKAGAERTKCVWYLDCNAVTETIHVAKGCAPSNGHATRMCALVACCFAITTVERQHVSSKKTSVTHLV